MDLVFDSIYCDTVEFRIDKATLNGIGFLSMDEQIRALAEALFIEVVDYDNAQRMPLPDGSLQITLRGGQWLKRLRG